MNRSDVIDFVEEFCGQQGSMAMVGPEYYDAFLALSDEEMAVLARTVLHAQAKEARRLTFAKPTNEAPTRLFDFASDTLFAIATGIARFTNFAQLGLYKRIGPEPEPEVHDTLTKKIADARPVIEIAVRDFIRQQHDPEPGAHLYADRQPSTPSTERGWRTTCDPEVESACITQVQLSLFPPTPREA